MHATAPPACDLTAPCALGSGLPRDGQRAALDEALRRFDHEARRGICDTGRYRCPYYVWGDGPPLVFVHGLCDDALSFLLPVALLSEHFRCVAYDLPTGEGDGARLARYRHADYLADLLALLDHLGLPRAYLVGSSFGSTIALAAMHAQPRRFPRATLQGGFARRPLAPAEAALAQLARYWRGPMRRLPFRAALMHLGHERTFAGQAPEVWDYFLQRTGAPPMAAVARRALLLHALDLRPLLAQIQQPILMVCGEQDRLVGRPHEEALLEGLPNATRVIVEGCGHLPYFSHPETLAGLLHQFFTPPPCAAPPR